MAITLDSAANTIAAAAATTTLTNFTISSRQALLVVVATYAAVSVNVSSINWNGDTSGWVNAVHENDGSHVPDCDIWYKIAPTPGTGNFSVTLASSPAASWQARIYSLLGTKQTSPIYGATGQVVIGGTSVSDSVNIITPGDWLIDGAASNGVTPTAGGGQSSRQLTCNGGGFGGTSTKQSSGAGSTSMSWTFSAGNMAHGVVGIAQAPAGAGKAQGLLLNVY